MRGIPASSLSFATISIPTLWTTRFIATLWKLAIKRARKLRQPTHDTTNFMYGSGFKTTRSTSEEDNKRDFDELSIIKEAALWMVASGVVSLADLEAVTGYRLSEACKYEVFLTKDNDMSSETATCMSDCSSVANSDVSNSTEDEHTQLTNIMANGDFHLQQQLNTRRNRHKPSKWVCVGYGRYVKEEVITRI